MASMLTGHNPIVGAVLGKAAEYIGKEVPDKVRLSMLRMLGSEMPTNAKAFKQMTEYVSAVSKGEAQLKKATDAAVTGGAQVIAFPDKGRLEKLDKVVEASITNPEHLADVGAGLGHYMPEHTTAIAAKASGIVVYLSSIKPKQIANGPLGSIPKVSKVDESRYNEALAIAEQPAILLNNIKDGTITPMQVQHLQVMYPEFYNHLGQKLLDAAVAAKAKNGMVPYKTRLSLSTFLQQPMDASLAPASIMANQVAQAATNNQQPPPKANVNKIRSPANSATPLQNREMDKLKH
jgi:hypothetical protein